MADIVISEFMHEGGVADLGADFDVLYDPSLVDQREQLIDAVADARGLVVRNRTLVDGALLAAAPRLRVVGRLGVGLDNIDLDACAERGVEVRPATGANAVAVAEYVIAAILVLTRGVFGASAELAAGAWPRQELIGGEVSGRRLGLVGLGVTARHVAARADGLGMEVAAFDPYLDPDDEAWTSVQAVDLDTLLAESAAVSLHVPLGSDTRHLVDAEAIDRMPDQAILVNTARGGVVDQAAVADALREGRLGGAALDVFETEPLDDVAMAQLSGAPNLILTPHIAGVTRESSAEIGRVTAGHVRDVLGRP